MSEPTLIGQVDIGLGVEFGMGAVLRGPARIGDRARIGDFAVIGADSRVGAVTGERAGVVLGSDVFIGSHATIDSGTTRATAVSDGCAIGAHSHVGHDCLLLESVILSIGVKVGGHVSMCHYSGAGLGAVVHPRTVVGPWAFIGAGSTVLRNVAPVRVVAGSPARDLRWNIHALVRSGLAPPLLEELRVYCEEDGPIPTGGVLRGIIERHEELLVVTVRNEVLRDWSDASS